MMTVRTLGTRLALLALSATLFFSAHAQTASSAIASLKPAAQSNRVAAHPDFTAQSQLTGHIPSWVQPSAQIGTQSVDLSAPLHISVVLSRDSAVQAAFDQLLVDLQNPSSPLYHQWLTPQQLGTLYGPTASDLAAITNWLSSQGLTVDSIAPNKVILEVSGPISAVSSAFRTSFAYFNLDGKSRFSATSEPSIPTALAPVILSIAHLTSLPIEPQHQIGTAQLPSANNIAAPQYSNSTNTTHYIAPGDFSVIYDVNSVYTGGNTGAKIGSKTQHVAVIGRSRVSDTDMSEFATTFNLSPYNLTTIIAGTDPGSVCPYGSTENTCSTFDDQGEQTLDVQRIIGTANGAQTDLVISASSNTQDGVYIAAAYNVNTLLDPIQSISYGLCEVSSGSSYVSLLNTLFAAAEAEGIATFVSSGDSGANGCAPSFTPNSTAYAASINALCSSTHVTCVGGTEFNDVSNPSSYWTTNGSYFVSARSYIPEGAWNEPTGTSNGVTIYVPGATGGGASRYIAKPSWQSGTGVPADGFRDVPDISFSASDHDAYFGCLDMIQSKSTNTCASGYVSLSSGTSAAAPGMAGIAALLNTKLGAAQGNINPTLYKLAGTTPSAFHDVTIASSGVSGCDITIPSMCNNSTPGSGGNSTTYAGGVQGFLLTTGYDEATGLGSLDVANFLTAAVSTTVSTTLTVTASPNPATVNQTVTLTATLTPGTSSNTATGTVQFYSNGTAIGSAATITNKVASITTTFTTAGSYSITAIYSGDTNFATSTAPAVTEVVTSPSFTVTPALTTLPTSPAVLLPGGSITDTITVTSTGGFAGSVALACAVTNYSGSAAGTCTILPTPAVLTSGSTATPTLTINSTANTAGTLHVTVTGTSGSTVITSAVITVAVTAPSFTLSASPASVSLISGASATSTVTVTSINSFVGSVPLSCAATPSASGSCSVSPTSVTLAANGTATATVTVTTTPGTSGNLVATVTGATTGSLPTTATATITASLTASSFSLSASPTSLTLKSGAVTGNTAAITVTPVNGFLGTVTLSCAISSGTAYFPPTCTVSPATVNLTSGSALPAAITISSTTAQAKSTPGQAGLAWPFYTGGTLLAFLFFLPSLRRHRRFGPLAILAFMALIPLSGCGGSSTPVASTPKSSAGTYTITITGTGTTNGATIAATPATTTLSLTIN